MRTLNVKKIIFMLFFIPSMTGLAMTFPNPAPGAQINYEEECSADANKKLSEPRVLLEEPCAKPQKFNHLADHQLISQFSNDNLERPPKGTILA